MCIRIFGCNAMPECRLCVVRNSLLLNATDSIMKPDSSQGCSKIPSNPQTGGPQKERSWLSLLELIISRMSCLIRLAVAAQKWPGPELARGLAVAAVVGKAQWGSLHNVSSHYAWLVLINAVCPSLLQAKKHSENQFVMPDDTKYMQKMHPVLQWDLYIPTFPCMQLNSEL